MRELLTVAEAAVILKVCPRTVRRAIAGRGLRAFEVATDTWRIDSDDLAAWLEQRASASAPAPAATRPRTVTQLPPPDRPARRGGTRRTAPAPGRLTLTADMGRTA